mgnify:CR=1 FL=1|tara:strand:- start:230 stop:1474 length:1245 start_codon:yes stop_codon:yes gene_type:complete
MSNGDDLVRRAETIQRRPEYIERFEKALLSRIFGDEVKDTREGAPEGSTILKGGILDADAFPNLFRVAPYKLAGQQGRAQPIRFEDIVDDEGEVVGQRPVYAEGVQPGDITGFGLETFAAQALSQDLNNDGVPDFMGRYTPYFETAGGAATGGLESLRRGLGTVGEAKTFFGPAAQYVSGGRGMYDPSQYVSQFMSPYTSEVIDEVEKDIERQGNVARQRASAQAVGRGAFGGSRQGIQAAEIERNIQDAKAKATADLRSRAYDQALAASQQAYQQGATRELEAGRLMGGLGQSVGQLGTQFGSLGGQYGSLAGTTADIGRVYSALQPADLAFMTGVGEAERAYRQQMIDTARQEYQRPTEQALLPYQFAYGALTGTPSAGIYSQTQASYAPPANPFLSGLGAYTTLQGINQAS